MKDDQFPSESFQIFILIFAVSFLVKKFVQTVEVRLLCAVQVVPPVADEVLLVKHRSIWTEEASAPAIWLTHIEDLTVSAGVRVDPGKVLLGAAETRVGD